MDASIDNIWDGHYYASTPSRTVIVNPNGIKDYIINTGPSACDVTSCSLTTHDYMSDTCSATAYTNPGLTFGSNFIFSATSSSVMTSTIFYFCMSCSNGYQTVTLEP